MTEAQIQRRKMIAFAVLLPVGESSPADLIAYLNDHDYKILDMDLFNADSPPER